MDPLLVVAILAVAVGLTAWYRYGRGALPGGRALLGRGGGASVAGASTLPLAAAGGPGGAPTLRTLNPGDAISFWDGEDDLIRGVMACREELDGRTTEWQWVFLEKGRVVEVLPAGQNLYASVETLYQGDDAFQGMAGPDGALARFEGHVREGMAGEIVTVDLGEATYRVRATGTFTGALRGEVPRDGPALRDLSGNAADNVYVKLTPHAEGEEADGEALALGVWTTHITLLSGRPLGEHEVTGIYPRGAAGRGR